MLSQNQFIMKTINFVLGLIICLVYTGTLKANELKINFASYDLKEARIKAGTEGKLIFIDFYASWCTPCKWMDQTTFIDEEVADILNSNFISIKADIDETQGFELKNVFDIKYLPTMIIFNSEGRMIDRIEQTLSPHQMRALLKKYNAPENKQIVKYGVNTAPNHNFKDIDYNNLESMHKNASQYQQFFGNNKHEKVFNVQLGVFERYQSADEMVKSLRQLFVEPMTITNEIKNGVVLYKVRIGQFSSYDEALQFKKTIRTEYNMDGLII